MQVIQSITNYQRTNLIMRNKVISIQAICCLLLSFLSYAPVSAQIAMPTGLVANDDAMFIVVGNEIKGSYHVYQTLQALDTLQDLSANRLQEGMLVTILDADNLKIGDQTKTFMLTGDATSWVWKEISLGFVDGSLSSDTIICKALVLDGDTVLNIAKAGDTVTMPNNTVPTISYLDSAIVKGAATMEFAGNRNITRDIKVGNASLKGENLNTENIVEFLEAVFFPKSAPRIDVFTYSTSSTPVIAYSVWSKWLPKSDIVLDWQVTNISKTTDGLVGPEYDITAIVLKNDDSGADVDGTPSLSSDPTVTGTFSAVQIDATGKDVLNGWSKDVTMQVTDGLNSVTTQDLSFTFSPAVNHVLGTPSIVGSVNRLRTGSDISLSVAVPITVNDEIITSLTLDGAAATIPSEFTTVPNMNAVSKNFSVQFPHANAIVESPSQIYAAKKDITVTSTGDIFGVLQTKKTGAIYQVDKAYVGYIADFNTVTDTEFLSFTDNEVTLNPYGMLTSTDNGYPITNSYGNNYHLAFAVPTYGDETKKFKIETFDVGLWSLDGLSDSKVVTTTSGGFSNSYYIIYTSNKYSINEVITPRIVKQ